MGACSCSPTVPSGIVYERTGAIWPRSKLTCCAPPPYLVGFQRIVAQNKLNSTLLTFYRIWDEKEIGSFSCQDYGLHVRRLDSEQISPHSLQQLLFIRFFATLMNANIFSCILSFINYISFDIIGQSHEVQQYRILFWQSISIMLFNMARVYYNNNCHEIRRSAH